MSAPVAPGSPLDVAPARVDFCDLPDLAAERVGGRVLEASDDFFADRDNLLRPGRGVWDPDRFTERGKWMDGWESRRRRTPGHDWALIRLGAPGAVHGVDVDTNNFIGNYPEFCSLEGVDWQAPGHPDPTDDADWTPLVRRSRLVGGTRNLFPIANRERMTHLRLRIYPDGGVARLRVHGEARPDLSDAIVAGTVVDLAALENGGRVVECSDMFFGHPDNMLLPGESTHMADGWETRRRRGPGHDWAVVRLGALGRVQEIQLDTTHFKGNFPDRCSIEGCELSPAAEELMHFAVDDPGWKTILPETALEADAMHVFSHPELSEAGTCSHIRIRIHPDGGVARLRVRCQVEAQR